MGREDELERIERALERADSAGVVVVGPAGVGKTRLVAEALGRVRSGGVATRWAVATESARVIPFGALSHLLPSRLPSAVSAANLLWATGQALLDQAAGSRLVLGVDDAHLLDDHSAALVHHLAATGRAAVVATVRAGEPAPDPIGALWKDGMAERLDVSPLTDTEVGDLLVGALGGQVDGAARRRLFEVSRGNVLFLRELVTAGLQAGTLRQVDDVWQLGEAFPVVPRLVELVNSHLGRLAPEERSVLEMVAAAEALPAAVLERLAGGEPIEALERRGLLESRVDGRRLELRCGHPLYAEVLRSQLPALTDGRPQPGSGLTPR